MKVPKDLSRFTKKEINAVFEAAFSVYKDNFITILAARPSIKPYGRILLITLVKLETLQNGTKIRRQIKSIVQENKLYEKSQDMVFIVKSLASKPSFDSIRSIVLQSYES